MKIQITARHLELTKAISAYLSKKVNRLERHFDHLVWASAILGVEKHRHIAEIVIHSPLHTLRAKAEEKDLYSAIDLVVDKADKQLKKLKEKWKGVNRSRRHFRAEYLGDGYAGPAAPSVQTLEETQNHGADSPHIMPSMISVVKQVPIKPVSVQEAVQAMESLGYTFWMFLNRTTKRFNVIFRRADQTYGLLEPIRK